MKSNENATKLPYSRIGQKRILFIWVNAMAEVRRPNADRSVLNEVAQLAAGQLRDAANQAPARANNDALWKSILEKPAGERDALTRETVLNSLRDDVLSLASKRMSKEDNAEFVKWMRAFDDRKGVSTAERAGTLLQVYRVMTSEGKMPEPDRLLLARLVVQNAAMPNRIDQGNHNTCNVTSLETRTYTRTPSIAAAVVADLAVNGFLVTANGRNITVPSLDKDFEAQLYRFDSSARNYASQLFQLGAVNVHWANQDTMPDGKFAGKGNIRYGQEKSSGGKTGEYIENTSVNPPQRFTLKRGDADAPQLDVDELIYINEQITGKREDDLILERNSYSKKKGVVSVDSPADLRSTLTRLKNENKFPCLLIVDAAMPPFGSDANRFARHAVTITDYDPATDRISVDNQYGSKQDLTGKPGEKPCTNSTELYEAMRSRPPFGQVWDNLKKNVSKMDAHDVARASLAGCSMTALYQTAFRSHALTSKVVGPGGAVALVERSALSKMAWRGGSALAAAAIVIGTNDLHRALSEGPEHAVGLTGRVIMTSLGYEIGFGLTTDIMTKLGTKNMPAKVAIPVMAGIACATTYDVALGENFENIFRGGYRQAAAYIRGDSSSTLGTVNHLGNYNRR